MKGQGDNVKIRTFDCSTAFEAGRRRQIQRDISELFFQQEQERQRHEVEADQIPLDEQCRMLEENGV